MERRTPWRGPPRNEPRRNVGGTQNLGSMEDRIALLENLAIENGLLQIPQGAVPRRQPPHIIERSRGNPNFHQRKGFPTQPDSGNHSGNYRNENRTFQTEREDANKSGAFRNAKRARGKDGEDGDAKNDKEKRNFGIGFKYVESLCEKDPEEIIVTLSTNRRFSEKLNENLSGDWLFLIVKVLAKGCTCAFDSNKTSLLHFFCKENFIDQLKKFVALLATHDAKDKGRNRYFWQNMEEFWLNLWTVCNSVVTLIPSLAIETIPKLVAAVIMSFGNLESQQGIRLSDQVLKNFEDIQERLHLCIEEMEKKKEEIQMKIQDNYEEEPPDNFRDLSVYPTSVEVVNSNRSFVRKNRVSGKYRDVEEYLDIQFRLLREDFVNPLRQGICQYLLKDYSKKIHTVKIYPKVWFLGRQNVKDEVGYTVQFELDVVKLKKNKRIFENSKRFMFGALVCFTRDNFESLIFGKIIERDIKMLEKGIIVVQVEGEITYHTDYTMVECCVYFEPYYHVLKALQAMDTENFPMERYIVNVDPEIRYPRYLNLENASFQLDRYQIDMFHPQSWPSANRLNLNDTQYEAFKAGLTKEFCIIQGPPGTGKTYLGLKIVKTLIDNKDAWYENCPILIVCYTNHALDQFLEGLLNTTEDIIRVGGQSKNEKLQPFNIKEKRVAMLKGKHSKTNRLLIDKRNALRQVSLEMNAIGKELESINSYNSVVNFRCFINVDPEFKQSWFATAEPQVIEEWLLGGRTKQERKKERRKIQAQADQEEKLKEEEEKEEDDDDLIEDEGEQHRLDFDDLEFRFDGPMRFNHMLSLETMNKHLQEMGNVLEQKALSPDGVENPEVEKLEEEYYGLLDKIEYLQTRLNEGKSQQLCRKPVYTNLKQPHFMPPNDRWQLYFFWLRQYKAILMTKQDVLDVTYRTLMREYSEVRDMEDVNLMKKMLVIGMTTTGAARLQRTLQALRSRIVIVEEAAEVLESHIVTSLTSHCAHLILIGDHKQLRPSTADYHLETYMNLGISLFERMVLNDLHRSVLGVQHRMRPEISRLIRPAVYPHLEDHESVLNRPPVRGIEKCLYFLHHTNQEISEGDSSKVNNFEAVFLIRLALHLVLNGYEPEEVTILAAYLGQFYTIVRERQKYSYLLRNVRVAVLDNYQGEECKIILLSLVRNNDNNSVGFLKIENRVCVALSRAKEGLYIMGNMDLLTRNSEIWSKIKPVLVEQGSLVESITLRCVIHQERITEVKKPEDFNKCPEGGCDKVCNMQLECGHKCEMVCHILNRDHQTYRCKSRCTRISCNDTSHVCPKRCYEECGPCRHKVLRELKCGHKHNLECHVNISEYKCPTLVFTQLPCGHEGDKPCHMSVEQFRCPNPCDTRLDCGHACTRQCHTRDDPDHIQYKCTKPCPRYRQGCTTEKPNHICQLFCFEECQPCPIVVQKQRTVCSHSHKVQCSVDVDMLECKLPCKKMLPCGHHCKKRCSETCGDCQVKVNKLGVCGHTVKVNCCAAPTTKDCSGPCTLKLPCGHNCTKRCKDECNVVCRVLVDHTLQVACGHTFQIPCHLKAIVLKPDDMDLLKHCRQPCDALLDCGHACTGSCGECYQGRVHKTCQEKCGVLLVCNHECSVPCRQACQPCTKPCEYCCIHSKCKKKCGEPCSDCMDICPRQCEHVQCEAKCGLKCTVPPCNEPCPKQIKCGHPCVGFCGDECPPLCRICDKEELQTMFLGFEDEEDARYVLLIECNHVIESQGMDIWLSQKKEEGDNEINVKRCPKCNTRLAKTPRYSDYVKEAMKDIINVKTKLYGDQKENETKRKALEVQLQTLMEQWGDVTMSSRKLSSALSILEARLQPTRNQRKQPIHNMAIAVVTSKLQLLTELVAIYCKHRLSDPKRRLKVIQRFDVIVGFTVKNEDRLTQQEIGDIQNEISRFSRMLQLYKIKESGNFKEAFVKDAMVKALYRRTRFEIFNIEPFGNVTDHKVNQLLNQLNEQAKAATVISERERKQIVAAVGLTAGHWFKCPNGHYYAIGECGGAMEISRCIECGAAVGGRNHALLQGSTLAREFGAQQPAWPTVLNNFANYVFD